MKVRLNFSMGRSLHERLADHCSEVGRTPTSVIRQLILEYLDGETPLPDIAPESGEDIRTSLLLPEEILEHFGRSVRFAGLTRSRVISALVKYYLDRRGENVRSDVFDIYRDALDQLVRAHIDNRADDFLNALEEALELLGYEPKKEEITNEC